MLRGIHAGQTRTFPTPLKEEVIVSRPNRFIIVVRTGGHTVRCHCPTTDRLRDVSLSGLRRLYSDALTDGRIPCPKRMEVGCTLAPRAALHESDP
jgi:hypothetical protein